MRHVYLDNADTIGLLSTQTAPVPILSDDLATLELSTTVVWGRYTTPTYRIVSCAAAASIMDARAVEVPNAWHLISETDPIRFADLLDAHLHILAA